jgi:hypothetical protein
MSARADSVGLPACHCCAAPASVKRDRYGIQHATWRHEMRCPVLTSTAERMRLDAAVARALSASAEARR